MIAHRPRKRFGQHFLIDELIIAKLVELIAPTSDQLIVEVGAGRGALTRALLERCGTLDAIELDRDLVAALERDCAFAGRLRLHQGDVLQFDFRTLYRENRPLRIVGNLPYNISTPLLFHLTQFSDMTADMYFMLQQEVVDRLVACCNDSSYGRLSIMAQYHFHIEKLLTVERASFNPPPQVTSAVVRLIPHPQLPYPVRDYRMFSDVVRMAFNQRRKTLRNALKDYVNKDVLLSLGIDPQARPETLHASQFAAIANQLHGEQRGDLCYR